MAKVSKAAKAPRPKTSKKGFVYGKKGASKMATKKGANKKGFHG